MKGSIQNFFRRQRETGGFFSLRYENRESWFVGHGIALLILAAGIELGFVIGWFLF